MYDSAVTRLTGVMSFEVGRIEKAFVETRLMDVRDHFLDEPVSEVSWLQTDKKRSYQVLNPGIA
jgi:hypothetical protein